MHPRLLDLIACPACLRALSCVPSALDDHGMIMAGALKCMGCGAKYPVESGIPRFVERENYALSFGYQWNRFKYAQLDSWNATKLSEKRWCSETGWTSEWLKGKWVIEIGCGAGRFLDVIFGTIATLWA